VKNLKQVIHQWAWIILLIFIGIGVFNARIGVIALICMVAPVAVAFFRGRAWCGVYCPRGSLNDVLLSQISFKGKIPALLRYFWFRITFLVVLLSAFAIQFSLAWGNSLAIGQVFVRMIIITTLMTLALGLVYQPRAWCLICPMGTMAHYVAKWRSHTAGLKLVTFQKDACVGCKICNKNCPINIDVYSYKKEGQVTNPDCLKCNTCVAKCPKKALTMK
jgi:ferredoxin-type protein NapH